MKINIKLLAVISVVFLAFSTPVQASGITVARAFYELAHQNNTQKIELLLNKGYSIESVEEHGYNPVCLAVVKQDRAAYKTLTSYGAAKKPSCLQKVPENAYQRFFGTSPAGATFSAMTYTSDVPYLIGATALGIGAVATAYALRGDTDKNDHGGGSGGGGGGDDDKKKTCPNGTYDKSAKKCICNNGYDNYGDNEACYASVAYCKKQSKATCTECNSGYSLKDNVCYPPIDNCQTQDGNICKECKAGYSLKDNVCYPPIANCKIQDGNICKECNSGFGIYGGDGTHCYVSIINCQIQREDKCQQCISGYGTHGDTSTCYKNIDNCMVQLQTACSQCNPGYDTYGNPAADHCYSENPCAAWEHTIPVHNGESVSCICNENKGYVGEPGSCSKVDEEEYHEGEGNTEEWNNLNAEYCNSHGKYNVDSKLCTCYIGYAGPTDGCSGCADGYTNLGNAGGLCYKELNCGEKKHQVNNSCVCDDEYYSFEGSCYEPLTCAAHHIQTDPETCSCKENFDESCTSCIEGYTYDDVSDECVRETYICEENWTGSECDICPSQFKITYDGSVKHCTECADNRLNKSENEDCSLCAEGFEKNDIDNTCIITECSIGTEGYIKREDGKCDCDTANGYGRSLLGTCVKKGEDIIGIKDSNINNSIVEISRDGSDGNFNDIYGMKPVIEDEEGKKTYYDDVYNAYTEAKEGDQSGTINILNKNVGGNVVYGIYSPNTIYNAAIYSDTTDSATVSGTINIKDENTISNIFGMANTNPVSIYNAFARSKADASAALPSNSIANASIRITKDEDSLEEKEYNGSGAITGITGIGNVLNAYASTVGGTAANVYAIGDIYLLHNGIGQVIGIHGSNENQKINNALSYLDSAISDSVAIGNITVVGNNNVYGIFTPGTIINSETQFSKNFPLVRDFRAEGNITATTNTDEGAAYGMYIYTGSNDARADAYNAYGYRSTGNITVSNLGGGSAYGIWNSVKTYTDTDEEGHSSIMYTNTYNAFRSSAKYGGADSTTTGNITVNITGASNAMRDVSGIYASGDVFNSYARSLSEEGLNTIGTITINDKSRTPGLTIKGIESGGAKIANAYATGDNLNTATSVVGNININVTGAKQGSAGEAHGIYSSEPISQIATIYNAALVQDTSNVTGNINVSGTGSTSFSRMYGIYASKYDLNGGNPDEGQEKIVYNAYYENDSSSEGSVTGVINVNTTSRSMSDNGEYYGIFINGGEAYNAYSTNPAANVVGKIIVDVAGGENKGMAVGMYGNSAKLYNTGNSTINVTTSRQNNDAYGMKAKGDGSYMENDATINVTSKAAKAYGMYIENGQAVNNENGVITVSGNKGSYGIYAIDNNSTVTERKVINKGIINLNSDENNIGIYANGSNITVYNEAGGKIFINGTKTSATCEGEDCTNTAIQLVNGAHFVNGGDVEADGDLDLSSAGENVIMNKTGKFKATNSILGNLNVATDVVTDNFDDKTVVSGAIAAADVSNLNIKSGSYLYNSSLKSNEDGAYDVVLERKDFNVLSNDKDDAKYLEKNYSNQKNMALFNTLKTASTASEARKSWAEISGKSVLPNITEEELKVQRSLDKTMMSELFKEGGDIRKMIGADALYIGRDNHGTLTGYDIDSQSMYALYDKKQNNNYRLGLGMSITHTNTEYNNDSRRKNFMVQGYVPLTYSNQSGLTAVSMARLGYTNGDYRRYGYNRNSFEADTEAITYGLLNEARYTYDMKFLKITPFIGLNASGWFQDAMSEGNKDLALHIASSHVFSLESALGMYLDKEIELSEDQKLNVALGLGYYHEFADPYDGAKAHHTGTIGHHRLKNTLHSRDRGILSAKVSYDYKNLSVYGELIQYLEEENPIEIEGGLQYKF